jgi:hypothetical protein
VFSNCSRNIRKEAAVKFLIEVIYIKQISKAIIITQCKHYNYRKQETDASRVVKWGEEEERYLQSDKLEDAMNILILKK